MKLYFSPGACSLSPHIILCESGFDYTLEKVNLTDKKTATGTDFLSINPKGYVPALQLESGEILTEGPAITQYLADKVPEKKLAPLAGTMERYRLLEWLNFISTELHKNFTPLFHPQSPEEPKQLARDTITARLEIVAKQLQETPYLSSSQFTIADAYLFTVLRWCRYVHINLDRWPVLPLYLQRIADRPAVHAAMHKEGLIKS